MYVCVCMCACMCLYVPTHVFSRSLSHDMCFLCNGIIKFDNVQRMTMNIIRIETAVILKHN